jgi:hypothetical protein
LQRCVKVWGWRLRHFYKIKQLLMRSSQPKGFVN